MFSFSYVFVAIGVLAVSLKNVDGTLTDEDRTKILTQALPLVAECAKQYGMSETDIKTAKETGKLGSVDPCLMACFFKKIKVIDDEGLFNPSVSKELAKKYVSTEDDISSFEEIIETCKSVNDASVSDGEKGCERAKLLYDCSAPFKSQFLGFRL